MARDINQLHPQAKELAEKLVAYCATAGLQIKITDCLRSKAEQDALYAQGRSTAGSIVTSVKYPNSMHNWGIAFDFCRNDGYGAYYDEDGFFKKVGQIGKNLGLEWGGDWTSFVDKPHFQLSGWGSTPSRLKSVYGTPENYMKTWTRSSVNSVSSKEEYNMPMIKQGSKGTAVKIWQVIIGVEVDGSFGPATLAATKKFQEKHGLVVDGIVGKNSWREGLESVS